MLLILWGSLSDGHGFLGTISLQFVDPMNPRIIPLADDGWVNIVNQIGHVHAEYLNGNRHKCVVRKWALRIRAGNHVHLAGNYSSVSLFNIDWATFKHRHLLIARIGPAEGLQRPIPKVVNGLLLWWGSLGHKCACVKSIASAVVGIVIAVYLKELLSREYARKCFEGWLELVGYSVVKGMLLGFSC